MIFCVVLNDTQKQYRLRSGVILRILGIIGFLIFFCRTDAATWTNVVSGNASGSWGSIANWTGGIPNATDAVADFSTLNLTVNSTVTNDAARTVGTLKFDDATAGNNWTLTGSNVTLATSSGTPAVNVVSSSQTTTMSVGLAGSQGFVKSGAGTLLLSGGTADTIGGTIIITNGQIQTANGASLKNVTASIIVATGAVLTVNGNFDNNANSCPIVLNGTGNGSVAALYGYGNQTMNGGITLNSDSKISHSYNIFTLNGNLTAPSGSNNLEMSITVSGQPALAANGNVNLGLGTLTVSSVAGGAAVTLGGSNTLGGVVVQNNGTVVFGSTNAIGGIGPRVVVNDGGTAALSGTDLNPLLARVVTNSAGVVAFNGASSSTALNFGNYTNVSLGSVASSSYSGVLTPGGGNYQLGGGGGTLTVSSGLTNLAAGLVVNGSTASSTVVLTGSHTYTNATIITGGTLMVTGVLAGPVVVQSGGTLAVGVANSTIGTLSVSNNVILGGSAVFAINRTNLPSSDLLSAVSIVAGGAITITNIGAAPVMGDTFQLISGLITNQFLQITGPTLGTGLMWDYSQLESSGKIVVVSSAPYDVHIGPATVVPIPANPVYYYANDSVTPYLPNSNMTANITFWVDGVNYRSLGASFDTMGAVDPRNSVLSGTAGTWDGGDWLLCAIRQGGTLYGFYHAEDYTCNDAFFWSTTGMAMSTNDGVSWAKQGQVIGNSNPCGSDGGVEAGFVAWDHNNSRWLSWGHGTGFVSYATNAAPGTWKGWDGAGFNTPMPGDGALATLPGMSSSIANCAVAWSTYLNRWIMVYQTWGSSALQITTSDNGVSRWTTPVTIYSPATTNETTSYVQWIGFRADWIGQDCLLVYGDSPPTKPGQRKDMVERWVHFGQLTTPATPANLAAMGVGTFGTNVVFHWSSTPQTDAYLVWRATKIGGPFTLLSSLATSASFPSFTDTNLVYGQTYYYAVQSSNSVGMSSTSSVASASAAIPSTNGVISINFVGGSSTTTNTLMDASEVAGVTQSAPNWNNAVGKSGQLANLKFGAGAGSGTVVSWASSSIYSIGIPNAPGDYRMMNGYLDGSSSITVTVSNIPAIFTIAVMMCMCIAMAAPPVAGRVNMPLERRAFRRWTMQSLRIAAICKPVILPAITLFFMG